MSDLREVTEQRGSEYGDWRHQSTLAQALKKTVAAHMEARGVVMDAYQAESLDMILHKISRMCNGNPNNPDTWLDIAGYATITYERLPRPEEKAKAASKPRRLVTG